MRAFLSKLLLLSFIVIFAVPGTLFAQNNWTPPAGAPLGNNVPAPVNIGISDQTKAGGLQIRGNTVVNTPLGGGSNFFLSFVPSYFWNNIFVGGMGTGPTLDILGKLKYKPAESDGTPTAGQQPQPGYVLTALDTAGTVGWQPSSGGGGVEPCVGADCPTVEMPAGLPGQTMWFNGSSNAWEATSKIFHDQVQTITGTGQITYLGRTQLNEPYIALNGTDRVTVGSGATGNTYLYSPTTVFGMPGYQQNVNFLPDTTVRFSGSNPGVGKIPLSVDTQGKFEYNDDLTYTDETLGNVDVGKLTLRNPDNGAIALFENQGLSSLWGDVVVSEEGKLYLQGISPAYNSEMGQDIIKPLCYVTTTGKVVTCVDDPVGSVDVNPEFDWSTTPTDYEVLVTYDDYTDQQDPEVSYQFGANQTVTIQWCGGGSGGGGGGIGNGQNGPFSYDDEEPGNGGGGGGGGKAGDCETQSVPVSENDVLTWNIGPGGAGGNGGIFRNAIPESLLGGTPAGAAAISTNTIAAAGQSGGATSVYLNGVPLGPTQLGASNGGMPGFGSNNNPNSINGVSSGTGGTGGHNPGIGANQTLSETDLLWHDGRPGVDNLYQGGGPYGGLGGDGESPSGNVSGTIPSAGGNGGIWGQVTQTGGIGGGLGVGNVFKRYGGDGQPGEPGRGGGGGGGGYGQTAKLYPGYNTPWNKYTVYQRRGGNAGGGGGGYVKISGLFSADGSSGVEEATPGPHQFALMGIPLGATTVDIEVWGAGGGGGGRKESVLGLPNNNVGGGGGAGGYTKIQNVPVMQLCPGAADAQACRLQGVTLAVGQGGGQGESDSNIWNNNGVTSGTAGQASSIIVQGTNGPVVLMSAGGGGGGLRGINGDVGVGGAGGAPSVGGASGNPLGSQQGAVGATGGAAHGGTGISNFGSGGQGDVHNNTGSNYNAGPGAPGHIRISWQ